MTFNVEMTNKKTALIQNNEKTYNFCSTAYFVINLFSASHSTLFIS